MADQHITSHKAQGNTGMSLVLLEWKAVPRNSMRGFATVRLGKALKIRDVIVHCNSGRRWANMPAKPMTDKDGNPIRDDRGKIKYVPLLEWLDKDSADRFSEAVIAAVEAVHPGETGSDFGT